VKVHHLVVGDLRIRGHREHEFYLPSHRSANQGTFAGSSPADLPGRAQRSKES
jgi:hypothetical protein